MSSSPEPLVLREVADAHIAPAPSRGELRVGGWTRLGTGGLRGDAVTESMLAELAGRTEAAARAQGYAAGWAEGRRAAAADAAVEALKAATDRAELDQRRHDEHVRVIATLTQAAAEAAGGAEATINAVQDRAVEVAFAVAEAVVGAELAAVDHAARLAVRRALDLAPPGRTVRLRLHPDALATLDVDALAAGGVEVREDLSLTAADAVIENDDVVVDATIASALARVREVLS